MYTVGWDDHSLWYGIWQIDSTAEDSSPVQRDVVIGNSKSIHQQQVGIVGKSVQTPRATRGIT